MATHTFEPDRYHRTLGPHTPVLHIESGDTVHTTTVDARGYDRSGEQVTPSGNPQTGPFFVEGAAPGDVIAVHFDRLRPNRKTGWTGTSVAPGVLDPDYAAREWPQWDTAEWTIDTRAGQARLSDPPAGLEGLVISLAPMIGCFGVAPEEDQAISTATSACHGGNMDYRGFCEGVTVYFPVFADGALFFIGDGHALQGDGEIAGTGIETSFDVRFTIHLIRERQILWPRGQDETHIFTAGNARPLDQATQHATTEMIRWLCELGLEPRSAHIVMGQCVEYDLGNMFDPAYTMICRMKKTILKELGLAADDVMPARSS